MGLTPADRVELTELVDRYAALVDQRRFGDLPALFLDDGELVTADVPGSGEPSSTHRGHAAILAAMIPLQQFRATLHAIVGRTFEPGKEAETASGRISCVAHHISDRADGGARALVWHMHYDDCYRRQDGSWRFARRALTVHWTEVRPVRA